MSPTLHPLPPRRLRFGRLMGALAAMLLLTWSALPAHAKRVALLIGNQAYVHERPLRNPVADAELLAQVLRDEHKFDVVRVERNLTLGRMDAVVRQFAEQAKGATTVVFYFSGHGLTASEDRRSFLLPVDARTGAPDSLPLHFQALAAKDVRDRLQAAGARVTLMLLDACRNGPGGGKSGDKGLARVGGGEQFLVAYATEEGQIAEDGSGRNSPYAQALAEAWRQPLPILAQLDKVYDLVTAQFPGQRPTREGNLRTDAFLGNPFSPLRPGDRERLEDEAWALCRGAVSRVPCDEYLGSWPQGRYAGLARTKIRDIESRPGPQGGAAPVVVQPACPQCPEVVVLEPGRFTMGSAGAEAGRGDDEGPQRTVSIGYRLAVGRTEVTRREFGAFVSATGYRTDAERDAGNGCAVWNGSTSKWEYVAGRSWRNPGFEQGEDHPVVCVSWNDVQAYVKWLNEVGGVKGWRLLSEAEWEYAARAGTSTRYPWGGDVRNDQQCGHANGADRTAKARVPGTGGWTFADCDDGHAYTAPVRSFQANRWGLHDMQGNALEWVQDCYDDKAYAGKAPSDGKAYEASSCERRVLRGGAWGGGPQWLRSAIRSRIAPGNRGNDTGFRLARTVF